MATSPHDPSPQATPQATPRDPLVDALIGWGPWTLAIAASPGLLLWPLRHLRLAPFVYRNDLSPGARLGLLVTIAASVAIVLTIYLAVWWRRRRREPAATSFATVARELNRDLVGLLALPFIGALCAPLIETAHPNLTLLYAGLAALAITCGAYHLSRHGAAITGALGRIGGQLLTAPPRWLPMTAVTAIFAGYSLSLARFALIDHRNIWTQIFDLGIYDNILWRTLHGDFLGSSVIPYGKHWAAHFDPILALLVPIYALAPEAETLLIIQAFWLGSGVFPVYRIAVHTLGHRGLGVVMAAIYALHPALHGVNMFDFHSLALAIPVMIWAVYAILRRSWGLWPALALLLACREDMALLACFLGAFAIVQGQGRRGAGIIGLSLAYLAFVKLVVMPDPGLMMSGDKVYGYASFYSEMIPRPEEGVRGLVLNLLSNPLYALQVLAKEEKLRYFVQLLLPLLFLPLFAGRARILGLYGLIFIGLASRPNIYALNFQYSSVLLPMLVAMTPIGLARLAENRHLQALGLRATQLRPALASGLLAASLLTTWKFGVFVENDAFKAGWQPLTRNPDAQLRLRADRVREMVAAIPADAAVSASSEIGPQLSNRAQIYRWPEIRDADYLLLGAWRFKDGELRRLERLKGHSFEVLDEHDGVILLRRIPMAPKPRHQGPRR